MNADILLAHYDRIADAPDAVARLRRFVLDLAVRGKLVPQEEGDESAVVLLQRLKRAQREAASREGLRSRKPVDSIERGDLWFDFPESWSLTKFDDVFTIVSGVTKGQHVASSEAVEIPYLRVANVQRGYLDLSLVKTLIVKAADRDRYALVSGDVLMTEGGDWDKLGRAAIWSGEIEDCIHQNHVFRVRSPSKDLHAAWTVLYVNSVPGRRYFEDAAKQTTNLASINMTQLRGCPLPLPPLAEQRRIVAKVDELMALCDQLEAARVAREETRDRMAAASLARLNNPDPETFPTDARFALDTLPALTTRPDQVKELRQTILNLAVRGKLVPQLAEDEPASELIERIHALSEKKLGTKSRYKNPPFVYLKRSPSLLGLPDGWAWACFPELGVLGRGKSKHRPRNDPALYENGQHPFIQTGDVARSNGVIRTFSGSYNDVGLSQSHKWPRGTLCITIAANIADSGVLDFDACFPDSVVGFTPSKIIGDATYFEFFMRTAKARLLEFAPATAQKNINLDVLSQVLIPLPPLPEQRRIVAKVNELMALCYQLEASLIAANSARARLLEATLHAALAPAAPLLNAAE